MPAFPRRELSIYIMLRRHLDLNLSVYGNLIMTHGPEIYLPGLSPSFQADKSGKMLRKNQYLLLPHVPNRGDKMDVSNSTSNGGNETGDANDSSLQHTVNHNFLMETSEHNNLAVINENDENYFEIFNTPMRFGTENHTEVTAQIGTTAHLPCTIHNIGEGVVSNYENGCSMVMMIAAARARVTEQFHRVSGDGKQRALMPATICDSFVGACALSCFIAPSICDGANFFPSVRFSFRVN
jgi:hypothetical protein